MQGLFRMGEDRRGERDRQEPLSKLSQTHENETSLAKLRDQDLLLRGGAFYLTAEVRFFAFLFAPSHLKPIEVDAFLSHSLLKHSLLTKEWERKCEPFLPDIWFDACVKHKCTVDLWPWEFFHSRLESNVDRQREYIRGTAAHSLEAMIGWSRSKLSFNKRSYILLIRVSFLYYKELSLWFLLPRSSNFNLKKGEKKGLRSDLRLLFAWLVWMTFGTMDCLTSMTHSKEERK